MSDAGARTQSAGLAKGVGRGFGGALLFALPIFMTMEMWQLGVSIDRWRLMLLFVVTIVLAFRLEAHFGMRGGRDARPFDSAVDAAIAVGIGATTALVVLAAFSVVHPVQSWREAAAIVAIEALPATLGASFARSQMGQSSGGDLPRAGYVQALFLMAAGAVVFCANIAPTEEVVLLAARMEPVHGLVVAILVVTVMHLFVYALDFKGSADAGRGFWSVFTSFTLVGYTIALAVSAYLLWSFGRYDDTGLLPIVMEAVVLSVPAGMGAAAARLIL